MTDPAPRQAAVVPAVHQAFILRNVEFALLRRVLHRCAVVGLLATAAVAADEPLRIGRIINAVPLFSSEEARRGSFYRGANILSGMKSDVGVGLRIGVARFDSARIRIDMAYALNDSPLSRRGRVVSMALRSACPASRP